MLEILIAMALLLSAFTVTTLLASSQSVSVDTETSVEALTLARGALESEQSLARKDFKLVVATTSTAVITRTPYTTTVTVAQIDLFTKKVTATVAWPGTYGRNPSTSLTVLITNFANAVGGDTCSTVFSNPGGATGWKMPIVTNAKLATIVGDNAAAAYPITDMDAYQGRLYVSIATSSTSVGPMNPSTAIVDTSVGTSTWANAANVEVNDASYATSLLASGQTSNYLEATGFGFSIPPGATILGITADIERKGSSSTNFIKDNEVRIVRDDGTFGSQNKANSVNWPTSESYHSSGGPSDTWGENWTPAMVNSVNFGVVISAMASGGTVNRTASVDTIRLTVYYTKQLYILDISNPANPTYLGGLATNTLTGGMNAVAVATSSAGNYAYVATDSSTNINQLQIIDVTDPSAPFVKSTFPAFSGSGMGKGVGTSIFYKDGYVYEGLTTGASGPEFNIIDVSNPALAVWKGGYAIGKNVNAIIVKDGYAYLSTNDTGKELVILNVTNPASPTLVGIYNATPDVTNFGYGRALYTVGDTLYLGRSYIANAPEFSILNTTNTASPALIATKDVGPNVSNPFSLNGIVVRDSLAFLLLGSGTKGGSLQIINATSTATVVSTTFPGGGTGVGGTALDCEGNYLYAASVDSSGEGYITSVTGQ